MPTPGFQKDSSTCLTDTLVTQYNLPILRGSSYHSRYPRPTGVLLAVILLAFSATSFQVLAHENHGSVSLDGRFTPNVDGAVFPPQPRGASNVRIYTPSIRDDDPAQARGVGAVDGRAVRNRVGAVNAQTAQGSAGVAADVQAAQAALGSADVQALLGDRYSLLKSTRVRDKARRSKNVFRVEFFSRSENRTIIAKSVDGVITQINSYAASERQPPLGEEEKVLAIAIARQYWADRDDPRVAELDGYAIQTFQPDGSPYVSRVAYVSFHTQSPEPPELISWVDLSEEKVFRAEVVR